MWADRLLMAAPFIESWNSEVGWKNALRRAEMPAADGLIAAKWLSCCYKLQLPCAHCTSALVSRLSTFYPVFCTVDVAFAPDVGDRLSAVLSHIATCHRFTFLVFDLAGPAASGRSEQCGLGGHGFFCALLLDLGEIGYDDLCHHRNAVPVSESVAGVEAAVSLQLNPGQLAEAEVLAGRGLLTIALAAVAEQRRALRNQEDTGPCNIAGYVDHGVLELSARVPRRSASRLDPAEGRVRDRTIELAERS